MQSYSYFSVYVNIQTHHIIHLHTIVRTHTHTQACNQSIHSEKSLVLGFFLDNLSQTSLQRSRELCEVGSLSAGAEGSFDLKGKM